MDNLICLKWLTDIFEPETASTADENEWRLLIFDGYNSHLDPLIINFCWDHRIIPYCIPSHTSHITQPLDVGVFSSLQNFYGEEVNKLQGRAITNNNFPNLLSRARAKALTPQNIKAGFRGAGIVPFRPDIILRTLRQPDQTPSPEDNIDSPINPPYTARLTPNREIHCT